MPVSQAILKAARILHSGGILAYPTEGVYGLGCLPQDGEAVSRILRIKNRNASQGLLLIAADLEQLAEWIRLPQEGASLGSSDEKPITWIVPARDDVPYWIRGEHDSVAVRLCTHPIARGLCIAAGSALVSTSANISGRPATRNPFVLRRQFGALVDYIVPGACGPAAGPSEIRILETGKTLRET